MTTGQRIKAARKKAGMTQKELAETAGAATGTIQQYERGVRQPRLAQLQRVAAALGVPVDFLIDDPNRFDVEDIKDAVIYGGPIGRVIENMQQLNLAGRQRVEAYSADMLQIAAYREDRPQPPTASPQLPPALQEGTDTTPAETPPEGRIQATTTICPICGSTLQGDIQTGKVFCPGCQRSFPLPQK